MTADIFSDGALIILALAAGAFLTTGSHAPLIVGAGCSVPWGLLAAVITAEDFWIFFALFNSLFLVLFAGLDGGQHDNKRDGDIL